MTKEDAEKLSVALLQVVGTLNETASFVRERDSQANWDIYRQAVGRAMAAVGLDLSEPLWRRYPELKPKELGGSYQIDPMIYEPHFHDPVDGA